MLERVFKSWSVVEPTKKEEAPLPNKDLYLPDLISGRILDLQLQCQKETISKDIIFQLIAEYTRAVQFYQEQGNQKYKLYQKRMHNFLNRPMIQSILKGQSGTMVIKKQRNQNSIKQAENVAEKQMKQIMKKHEQKQKIHEKKMNEQITKQEQILEERIRKKRISSNRSMQQKKTVESDTNKNNQQSGKKQKQRQLIKAKLFMNTAQSRKNVKKVFF